MTVPTLSIVMPVLNEAAGLGSTLQALAPLAERGVQLIVADGGSSDGTAEVARAAGATVILSSRGRALQMNAGANHSSAGVLLFLHADTVLPIDADQLIAQALASGHTVWGRFDVRIAGQSPMLRLVAVTFWREKLSIELSV